MGQTNSFTRFINSRKHIRLYAREYAEEHGLNASEVEKDIIQAKKYNHISFGEYAWTGFYDLTQEQKQKLEQKLIEQVENVPLRLAEEA